MKALILLLLLSTSLVAQYTPQKVSYKSIMKATRYKNSNTITNIETINQAGEIEICPEVLQIRIKPDGHKTDTLFLDNFKGNKNGALFYWRGYYCTLYPTTMTIYTRNHIYHYRLRRES